ncbi:uncharacterized protein LOC124156151 [Ischnura elegans]|uniref:uncharacterized protein LOC124156151 n=1 Tax=Ischnura elegans TaxID=197161 RepID=UPI001ED873E7|nr:uncharacterized protein LOC124156151 [Ischnura elegans]XP_046386463.1 uncharacterized protein LOC124156151 [Ischnura elegans]
METAQNSQDNTNVPREGETSRSPRTVERRGPPHNSIIFREIHKNAWLKRLPPTDRKPSVGVKKGERIWVVFCVHDDAEAFLEMYPDQRVAATHRPEKSYSLGGCRHVSPTICAQGDEGEFEFVVTLTDDHVRLIAPTWDVMMEWVDTLQSKLREMKILSPKENLYTRMPECRSPAGPLAPTRDPNSPLPPRPNGPRSIAAGLESQPLIITSTSVPQTITEEENYFFPPETSRVQVNSATTSLYITQSEPPGYNRPLRPVSRTSSTSTPTLEHNEGHSSAETPNITIIEVSASNQENGQVNALAFPTITSSGTRTVFNFGQVERAVANVESESQGSPTSQSWDHPAQPLNGDSPEINENPSPSINPREIPVYAQPIRRQQHQRVENIAPPTSTPRPNLPNSQFYDIPEGRDRNSIDSPLVLSNSQFYVREEGRNAGGPEGSPAVNTEGHEESVEGSLYERVFVPVSIPHHHPQERGNASQSRRRSTSEPPATQEVPSRSTSNVESTAPSTGGSNRANPVSVTTNVVTTTVRRPLLPPPQPYRQPGQSIAEASSVTGASGHRLTLREQQVLQLRKEMSHPGGVRLQLRRKDCVGSIALVDALGSVWVAGWKQKERPLLYNVLHFGDQLLSVCGVRVLNAVDAQRLIRGSTGLYVELLIRRIPFGRVYAIRRDAPLESGSGNHAEGLGLVLEGGTAEIKTVEPSGPAARAGLPAKAPTADGLSLCPWVLTEVNSRPLNPFFRDGEPAMRLGAVGGEVSVLVQPSDLARRIRKQLKSMRSYKDFIVQ